MMDDFEWQTLSELARSFNEEGRFIVFLGYEWSAQTRQGGHHNVLFRTPDRKRVPVQTSNDLPLLYESLRAENSSNDVLVIPHAHQAGDWNRSDPDLEKLVEISSMHGTFEWFGNLYLKNGFEIGFIAASDDHRGRPGYQNAMRMPVMTPSILSQKGDLPLPLLRRRPGRRSSMPCETFPLMPPPVNVSFSTPSSTASGWALVRIIQQNAKSFARSWARRRSTRSA